MKIKVKYISGSLRNITKKREEIFEFEKEITIKELIITLAKQYNLEAYFFRNGKLTEGLCFLVNGENMIYKNGPETMLQDGDMLSIIPLIGGG